MPHTNIVIGLTRPIHITRHHTAHGRGPVGLSGSTWWRCTHLVRGIVLPGLIASVTEGGVVIVIGHLADGTTATAV